MSAPDLYPRQIFPSSLFALETSIPIVGVNTQLPNLPAYGNNLHTKDHKFQLFDGPTLLSPNDVMYKQDQIRNKGINKDLELLKITYQLRTKDTRYEESLRLNPAYVDLYQDPNKMYNNGVSRLNQP